MKKTLLPCSIFTLFKRSTTRKATDKQLIALLSITFMSCSQAASLTVTMTDQKGQPVSNAVVKAVSVNNSLSVVKQPGVIDQINKEYVPTVVVVNKGSSVSFPNKDNIKHHVYSFSKARQFELPLYEGTPAKPVGFDNAGVVVLGCNIHDWMRGYIYVTDSQYTLLSDESGSVTFDDLPIDQYQLSLWHPQLKSEFESQQITVSEQNRQTLDFQLNLKPLLKIRRTTNTKRRRYN